VGKPHIIKRKVYVAFAVTVKLKKCVNTPGRKKQGLGEKRSNSFKNQFLWRYLEQ
jgi:hypothetical protein